MNPIEESPGEAYTALGFGVFVHYGLATFVGQTPWNYDPHDVEPTVYDPPAFDADQWMDAIAASGATYIMLTTKHHDGFTMWPSDHTDYGVHTSSDPVAAVWLDTPLHAREAGISEFVHSVSPDTAFIWKNYAGGQHMGDYPDADVRTFEGPTPEIIPCDYHGMPAEQAYNMAGGPGWWEMTPDAQPRGDVDEATSMLAYTQHLGAALTLNVSPGPTGQISPANVRLLEGIGERQSPR